jgi:hypothetical protein
VLEGLSFVERLLRQRDIRRRLGFARGPPEGPGKQSQEDRVDVLQRAVFRIDLAEQFGPRRRRPRLQRPFDFDVSQEQPWTCVVVRLHGPPGISAHQAEGERIGAFDRAVGQLDRRDLARGRLEEPGHVAGHPPRHATVDLHDDGPLGLNRLHLDPQSIQSRLRHAGAVKREMLGPAEEHHSIFEYAIGRVIGAQIFDVHLVVNAPGRPRRAEYLVQHQVGGFEVNGHLLAGKGQVGADRVEALLRRFAR